MNAPLIESQWGLMVGVLYNRQATGKKDEHGTHLHEIPAVAMAVSSSSVVIAETSAPGCVGGSRWHVRGTWGRR